jgi:hypothetical protein
MAVVRVERTWQANEFWDDVYGDPNDGARGRMYVGRWAGYRKGKWQLDFQRDLEDVHLRTTAEHWCQYMMPRIAEVTINGRPWSYMGCWVLSYRREYAGGVTFPRFWVLLCSIPNIPYGMLA